MELIFSRSRAERERGSFYSETRPRLETGPCLPEREIVCVCVIERERERALLKSKFN